MKRTPLIRAAVLACAAFAGPYGIATLAPREAHAEPSEAEKRTIAEALYAQGTELQTKGDYAAACPKFEEVTRLQPGKVGALMALAGCYEAAGKLASAKTMYEAVERAAAPTSDPRGKTAHDKTAALAPKIPRLVIAVDDATKGVPGLVVKRDEIDVGAPVWGVPIPVNPGAHVISASAPGKKLWSLRTDVAAGKAAVTITVPALEDLKDASTTPVASGGGVASSGGVAAGGGGAVGDAGTQPPPPSGGIPAWAWVSTGLGVAAIGVATGFGVDTLGVINTIEKGCGPNYTVTCVNPAGVSYNPSTSGDNAHKDRSFDIFLGTGIVGIGALTAGIVGIAMNAGSKAPAAAKPAVGSFQVVPMVSRDAGGLFAIGAF